MANPEKISNLSLDMQSQLSMRGDVWQVQQHRVLGLPTIIPGEAFSSWVWRVVATGLITRKQLLRKLKIKRQTHWVDGNPDLLDIEVFQKKFNGYSINTINSTLFFFDTSLNKSEIQCLTADILNKRPIYRYCPCCLKQDTIPYIRKTWRLAFSYLCQIHHCLLQERCPACNNILNLEDPVLCDPEIVGVISMQFCQICGHDLTQVKENGDYFGIVGDLLNTQKKMMSIAVTDINNDSSTYTPIHSEANNVIEVEEMERALIRFVYYDGVSSISVSAGLCGPNLFDESAERVGSYFLKHRLFPNTFWFSTNVVYQIYESKRLKNAIKWTKKL